jgi:hypothetical protein
LILRKDKINLIKEALPLTGLHLKICRERFPHLETAPAMYIEALRAPKAFR